MTSKADQKRQTPYSVSEAKNLESGYITVTGMIASYSTSYQTISKSEYECGNIGNCSIQGSETFKPPILLPLEKFDNTRGFNVMCFKCKSTTFTVNHTYHYTRSIQLEDSDRTTSTTDESSSTDRLEVVLYDEAASSVVAGEVVEIKGNIYIQRKSDSGGSSRNNKKLINVLHGKEIRYRNKEKVVITPKDIKIFYKHKEICDTAYKRELEITTGTRRAEPWARKIIPMKYVDRLVAMFAPNVIGHNDAKLGILRSLVGGSSNRTDHGDDNGRRGRINSLLVGDPGTAKSILARESTKIIPNSKYLNAQNTSGKSLIGIVDKESDGGLFLRLGPVVLAKDAVCAINEIGYMSPEDQGHLTDIAEEGRTTLVKYSTPFELDAPTTIIATANPYNTEWNSVSNISKDEIPILGTLIDRNDQLYAFRDAPSEQELRDYTRQKTNIRNRKSHNYNFLRKLIMYARTIRPEMTKDNGNTAEYRLNEFWTNARLKNVAKNRTYDSIFRIAEAQAKLNLSGKVDDYIATQTMDSMHLMLLQYGKIVQTIKSPRDIAYNIFLDILKTTKAPLSVEELCRTTSDENSQISKYFGNKFNIRDNKKLRTVVEMLLQHSSIKQIQQHPTVIQWFDNLSDLSDLGDLNRHAIADNDPDQSQIGSHRSPRSPEDPEQVVTTKEPISTPITEPTIVIDAKAFKCFYCEDRFTSNDERRSHRQQYHPERHLDYPTSEDFQNRLER